MRLILLLRGVRLYRLAAFDLARSKQLARWSNEAEGRALARYHEAERLRSRAAIPA